MTQLRKAELKASEWHSKYTRLRDCIRTTGTTRAGMCISCPSVVVFSQAEAGHFLAGRNNAYLFDEHCNHLQCRFCNQVLDGNVDAYESALIAMYGIREVERLRALRFRPIKLSVFDLQEIATYYREKYNNLLANPAYEPGGPYLRVIGGSYQEAA